MREKRLKLSYFQDEQVQKIPVTARYIHLGLHCLQSKGDPIPFDQELLLEWLGLVGWLELPGLNEMLELLVERGLVILFDREGKEFLYCPDMKRGPKASPTTEPPSGPRFDFDAIYQLYPRKEGKTKGMRTAAIKIRTDDQYKRLRSAVENYATSCRISAIESKYIKHFSTFMQQWEDYVPTKSSDAPSTAAILEPDNFDLDRMRSVDGS